jgi:hypothetical protein
MQGDKRFQQRIERIRRGKTWVPDGVVQTVPGRTHRRGRGGGAGLPILMVLAVPAALALAGPERLPEPVLGFFTAPTTEAAMASLGRMDAFAGLAR